MARYTVQLRTQGLSPRALSSIYSDLNAAGHLVMMYDAPKGKTVLECFDGPPWVFEYRRKFTDTAKLVARYERALEGFARFLRETERIAGDDS